MRLTGTWQGEYTYGEDYEDLAGTSVPFKLSLTESGLGALLGRGRIGGYVRDDASKGGQPERGQVHGRRHGTRLKFVKTMPVSYIADEGGQEQTVEDFYREQDLTLIGDKRHRIHYEGRLSEDGERAEGTWEIPERTVEFEEGFVELPAERGTWSAYRTSPLPTEL